uniref:Uncharacterized protein n=1 Tax=Anguilla anguilla TaxID=7936 RepID=A0A0E9VFR2_ANGAN
MVPRFTHFNNLKEVKYNIHSPHSP